MAPATAAANPPPQIAPKLQDSTLATPQQPARTAPRGKQSGYAALGGSDSDENDGGRAGVGGSGSGGRARAEGQDIPFGRMCWMLSGFVGAQMAWGVQTGIATPTFRELGISQSSVAIIW